MTEKYSKDEQNKVRRKIEKLLDENLADGGFKKHGFDCNCERCTEITRLGKKLFNGRTKFTTNYHANNDLTRKVRQLFQSNVNVDLIAQILEEPTEKIEKIIADNRFEKIGGRQ